MPYSVDGIGSNLSGRLQGSRQMSNEVTQSPRFSRSHATQAGAVRLGVNPATSQPTRLGVAQGGDTRDVRETSFDNISADAVVNMQMRERAAHHLRVQAVVGQLNDVHDYTITAAKSQLTIELSSTIRNKVVDMFNEIMRMQA